MPANLTAEAKSKLAKYSEAKTVEEKIKALEEFLSVAPKHKGAENLLLWAKRRLAELREEAEAQRRKRSGGGGPRFFVEKAGAGQVVMLGPPNSGKSSLLGLVTNARSEVAPYPFTTQQPVPGMLQFEDVQIQIVDTPPLVLEQPDSPVNNRVLGLARNADAVMIVVGLDDPDPAGTVSRVLEFMEERGIVVTRSRGLVRIVKSREANGIKVQGDGRMLDFTEDDLKRLLGQYRIYNAIVHIEGEVTLDDVEQAIFQSRVYKPAVVVLMKADLPGARAKAVRVRKTLPMDIPVFAISVKRPESASKLGEVLYGLLGIIRVYTKQPNKEPDPRPLILPAGSTVIEAARRIHKDLARNFKYAKIWGPSAKYPGQRVGAEHVLMDKDLIEVHTR